MSTVFWTGIALFLLAYQPCGWAEELKTTEDIMQSIKKHSNDYDLAPELAISLQEIWLIWLKRYMDLHNSIEFDVFPEVGVATAKRVKDFERWRLAFHSIQESEKIPKEHEYADIFKKTEEIYDKIKSELTQNTLRYKTYNDFFLLTEIIFTRYYKNPEMTKYYSGVIEESESLANTLAKKGNFNLYINKSGRMTAGQFLGEYIHGIRLAQTTYQLTNTYDGKTLSKYERADHMLHDIAHAAAKEAADLESLRNNNSPLYSLRLESILASNESSEMKLQRIKTKAGIWKERFLALERLINSIDDLAARNAFVNFLFVRIHEIPFDDRSKIHQDTLSAINQESDRDPGYFLSGDFCRKIFIHFHTDGKNPFAEGRQSNETASKMLQNFYTFTHWIQAPANYEKIMQAVSHVP